MRTDYRPTGGRSVGLCAYCNQWKFLAGLVDGIHGGWREIDGGRLGQVIYEDGHAVGVFVRHHAVQFQSVVTLGHRASRYAICKAAEAAERMGWLRL